MSVEIEPQELQFKRPFNVEVTEILRIKNSNRHPVAFKVKTTAPKQYCVRPNSGRIEPGQEVQVTVILQPMKQEPAPDAKCRDKFLVQSVIISPDKEFVDADKLWQHDEDDASAVQEKKIKVVYVPVGGGLSTPLRNGHDGGRSTSEDAPPAYINNRSPSPDQPSFTPDNRSSNSGPAVKLEDEPRSAKSIGDAKASAFNPATAKSSITESVPQSYEELKAKLAEAQATIATYAKEGGAQIQKVAKGETGNKTVNDMAHRVQESQGVPLQVVAALCFVSFLLAYMFF